MEDQVMKNGWQKLASDTANNYLYKAYSVISLANGLALVQAAVPQIAQAGQDKTTHLSLDGSTVTISINSPADNPLGDSHFELAQRIDGLTVH